jgi:hypothetical protein
MTDASSNPSGIMTVTTDFQKINNRLAVTTRTEHGYVTHHASFNCGLSSSSDQEFYTDLYI